MVMREGNWVETTEFFNTTGIFATMSTLELAKILVDLAQCVRLEALRKSPTRARKTRSNPRRSSKQGHVSTAKLLKSRKAKATAP
jgi:hypothetical protein